MVAVGSPVLLEDLLSEGEGPTNVYVQKSESLLRREKGRMFSGFPFKPQRFKGLLSERGSSMS